MRAGPPPPPPPLSKKLQVLMQADGQEGRMVQRPRARTPSHAFSVIGARVQRRPEREEVGRHLGVGCVCMCMYVCSNVCSDCMASRILKRHQGLLVYLSACLPVFSRCFPRTSIPSRQCRSSLELRCWGWGVWLTPFTRSSRCVGL